MARVSGNVLGNLQGRLGNLSARTVNGQTILSARPSSFSLSQTPESIQARKKFGVTGKFAKQVLENITLHDIWSKEKLPDISVFNTIFKRNYEHSSVDKPTADNIITPGGFSVPTLAVTLLTDNLTVELLALDTASVFTAEEVNLSASAIICYHNPTDPDDAPYSFISLNTEIANYSFDQTFELNLAFNVNQQALAAKYQNSIVYFAVASKNSDGKIVQYSATLSQEN